MLKSFKEIKGHPIHASDGEIGSVHDVMFESDCGAVRYLVVDTGGFLFGRKVLLAVDAVMPDPRPEAIRVDLTKQAVKNSPELDGDQPFSRRLQADYHDYYGWPYYWIEGGLRDGPLGVAEPAGKVSAAPLSADAVTPPEPDGPAETELDLFSARKLGGFDVIPQDEALADNADKVSQIDDIIFDTDGWMVRFLIVDRGDNDLTTVPVRWIEYIDWDEKNVRLLVAGPVVAAGPSFHGMDDLLRDNASAVERYFETAASLKVAREIQRTRR